MVNAAEFRVASDQSLLVSLCDAITMETHTRVRKLLELLRARPVVGMRDVNPAYCSVLVKFDGVALGHAELEKILGGYLERLDEVELPASRLVEIPVCYGGEFGPD